MHVASEILRSALTGSTAEAFLDLADITRSAVQSFDISAAAVVDEALKGQLFLDDVYSALRPPPTIAPGASAPQTESESAEVLVMIMVFYQAIRLAALLHDIGHPPFSHIVEYGFLEAAPDTYLGHEPRSLDLVRALVEDPALRARGIFALAPTFSMATLRLAERILQKDELSPFYGIKRTLLDGPIDADRLDYVRRDCYSAGLVSTYDIRRLVDAAFLDRPDGIVYEIGYRPTCLSAFENFFSARYDLYRWMIYHHDVVRRNLAIQRAISVLVHPSARVREEIKALGAALLRAAVGPPIGYRRFIDSMFLDKLWEVYELLEAEPSAPYPEELGLKFYLDIILARRNDKLATLLKRADQYAAFAREVRTAELGDSESARGAISNLNARLRARFEAHVADSDQKENVAKFRFAELIEAEMDSAAEAREVRGVKFYCYYLGTFRAGPDESMHFVAGGTGEKVPVFSVSPTLAALSEAWSYSPQLIIFVHNTDPASYVTRPGPIVFGAGALIHVPTLESEISALLIPPGHVIVDPLAGIITDDLVEAQRKDEFYQRHGSTMTGTGYAMAQRSIRRLPLARDVVQLHAYIKDVPEYLFDQLALGKHILVEGHQGAGLSNYHGDYPYSSSRDCTAAALLSELGLGLKHSFRTVLVAKCFPTRNHAGRLPGEVGAKAAQSMGIQERGGGSWGVPDRRRRVGSLDFQDLRRSILLNTPDAIALTGVDYLFPDLSGLAGLSGARDQVLSLIQQVEFNTGVRVDYLSTGPEAESTIDLSRRPVEYGREISASTAELRDFATR